jgi:hypothetical protein
VSRYKQRLRRLEAATRLQPGEWPADVETAKQRALARLWCRLGTALDAADHPRVRWARTLLQDDSPEQAAADRDTLQRWDAAHPETHYPEIQDIRARFTRKLDEIRQRLEARP